MEDNIPVRLSIAEARLDQLAGLITRCCVRCGIVPASGFEETITARLDALEHPLTNLKPPRFDALHEANMIAHSLKTRCLHWDGNTAGHMVWPIKFQENIEHLRDNGFIVESMQHPKNFRISWDVDGSDHPGANLAGSRCNVAFTRKTRAGKRANN